MLKLSDSVSCIKGVGEKTAALFSKLHIQTVEDLLLYLPRGFEEFYEPAVPGISDSGKILSVAVQPVPGSTVLKKAGRYLISFVKMRCDSSVIAVRFFNMPYIKKMLQNGETYVLTGKLEVKKNQRTGESYFSMLQPKIMKE